MQSEMSDDIRLSAMQHGFETVAALVMQHEELLAKLQLAKHARQWLRTSTINAHLFLLTYIHHMHGSRDAIQVQLRQKPMNLPAALSSMLFAHLPRD